MTEEMYDMKVKYERMLSLFEQAEFQLEMISYDLYQIETNPEPPAEPAMLKSAQNHYKEAERLLNELKILCVGD